MNAYIQAIGSPQAFAAFVRSLWQALLAGALAAVTAYQTMDIQDWADAWPAGLVAGLSILVTRGLIEGTYDGRRDDAGDIKPSDVGAYAEPLVTPVE
jgi:hypothetical protein